MTRAVTGRRADSWRSWSSQYVNFSFSFLPGFSSSRGSSSIDNLPGESGNGERSRNLEKQTSSSLNDRSFRCSTVDKLCGRAARLRLQSHTSPVASESCGYRIFKSKKLSAASVPSMLSELFNVKHVWFEPVSKPHKSGFANWVLESRGGISRLVGWLSKVAFCACPDPWRGDV